MQIHKERNLLIRYVGTYVKYIHRVPHDFVKKSYSRTLYIHCATVIHITACFNSVIIYISGFYCKGFLNRDIVISLSTVGLTQWFEIHSYVLYATNHHDNYSHDKTIHHYVYDIASKIFHRLQSTFLEK